MERLKNAAEMIARAHHADQTDKFDGAPYVLHLERVAALVQGNEAKTVAWLHDIVEDCGVTTANLSAQGFSNDTIEAVHLLTRHQPRIDYRDYIETIATSGCYLAIAVKIADLRDHLRANGPMIPDSMRERYQRALARLLSLFGVAALAAVDPVPEEAPQDLIQRLRARAMIEAPPDNEPDTRAAFEDVPEITFDELREIAALLNEAADALAAAPARAVQAEQDEPLHTGDDERVDLLTSILVALEEMEMDGQEADATIPSVIEDVKKLDAIIVAQVQRERAVQAEQPPKRCPRCDSPSPELHPSVQWEGEVQPCSDPWHSQPTNRTAVQAEPARQPADDARILLMAMDASARAALSTDADELKELNRLAQRISVTRRVHMGNARELLLALLTNSLPAVEQRETQPQPVRLSQSDEWYERKAAAEEGHDVTAAGRETRAPQPPDERKY